jgi:hypothetical protein
MQWLTVNDDSLARAGQTADFLQREFCPPGADPIWSADYFRWKLGAANPAGAGYISLAVLDDEVVGTVSLTRKRIICNGVEGIGGEVGDTYSSASVRRSSRPAEVSRLDPDPESYVNKSIFGRLASEVRARAEADGITLIYGTPNKNAYPGWVRRLGYFDFEACRNSSFSRPTADFLVNRVRPLKLAGPLLRGMEGMMAALHGKLANRGRALEAGDALPQAEELDALWLSLRPAQGFSLIRDAVYWRHRYVEHPLARYSFHPIRENGRLLGLAVSRLLSITGGRRAVSVAEWLLDPTIPFDVVLAAVMRTHRDSGAELFHLWTNAGGPEATAARRSLFSERHRIPIVFADTPDARTLDARAFRFYLGSADAI